MIELGCGLGLPAIAAALAGGRVLATDWSDDAVAMTVRNAARNDAPLDARVFRWDAPPEPLGPPWPLVLASDVLYEERNVEQLLALLPRLTAAGGEVWLADPGRATAPAFLEAAEAGWRRDAIPHDGPEQRHRAPAQAGCSSSVLSRCSDRVASRSAAPWTSTRLAIRPRTPPGLLVLVEVVEARPGAVVERRQPVLVRACDPAAPLPSQTAWCGSSMLARLQCTLKFARCRQSVCSTLKPSRSSPRRPARACGGS